MSFSARLKLIPSADGYDVMCGLKSHASEPLDAQPQPRPYIRSITFYVNNVVVAELQLGGNVSHDPIIGIHLTTLELYDEVSIIWEDTASNRGTTKVVVG